MYQGNVNKFKTFFESLNSNDVHIKKSDISSTDQEKQNVEPKQAAGPSKPLSATNSKPSIPHKPCSLVNSNGDENGTIETTQWNNNDVDTNSNNIDTHYDEVNVDHDDVDGDHDEVNVDHDDVHGDHDEVNVDHDDVHGDYDEVNVDHDDVHGDHDEVNGDHDDVHGDYDEVDGDYDEVDGYYDEVHGDLGDSDGEDDGSVSEFESDIENEENYPNKRQSRIIFKELDHIPDLDFSDSREKKLFNIAKEILTTEITYVKTLKLLDEGFHAKLEREGLIPKEALLDVFSNISAINQFHSKFLLPKLEERMANWITSPKLGDIFIFLAPFLKMYAEYVKNFDQAMTSLSKWKTKSPKFSGVIQDLQKSEKDCNNLSLEHHMLAPVQRVPRYKLLLTDYVSKLPNDSPDLEESKKSLEIISAAANHANESMKKTERFTKMLEIQEKFSESIITPSREFIMEGELIKISARNAQVMTRILVLFNDSLYYCTKVPATGKYKLRTCIELIVTYIDEPDEDIENRDLVFRVRSKNKIIDFQATSVEQKEKWIMAIKESIEQAIARNSTFGRKISMNETDVGKIAPIWVRDDAVTMCMKCTVAFTKLRRRHHCRACGKILCGSCSSYKARLEYDDNKINRVCETCYNLLTKHQDKSGDGNVKRKEKLIAELVLSDYLLYRNDNGKISKRWCVLKEDFTLYVYKAKKDVKAQIRIPLPGYKVKCEEEKGTKRVLKLTHQQSRTVYIFEVERKDVCERWLKHLECAIFAEPYQERGSVSSQATTPPSSPLA
ncbi:FYVE, RhoGEF and PH domain-containing protein 4-like isoform X2 [Xenia sp. Carnegie-2017]|uniref:FYVE, RhoGEF and PH domain-containing protein 4-like isoform X2 n=1 Tax=Xenia sp. Carnegie-2017 TaxID=2897299 RepID=UPI001F037797|nr:FYVE, RhoGEF and PH domain-containing protein 4-like isoform X2 [Xenia sp. Carnegie-2017]